jgi:DNA topoisomerase-2
MVDLTSFTNDDNTVVSNDNMYPISKVAANEWKSFAMYTVESRAIPNMIDGMKPVQRFYLYSSIMNSKSTFKKVSAVSGIISDYGYNHGESSAAGAGVLMAAEWNNNLCLIEGRGSFGTRLIQEAGAPRYVYTKLHDNFNKYIKDINLAPVHDDPEHEPPSFYLPVIPLVLVNGTKGIATGFATNVVPRDPNSVIKACREYLTKGKITRQPKIKFPDFKGTVVNGDEPNKYNVCGLYNRKSKTQLAITEVPYGFDRESYVKVLDKLEDDGDIVGYDDLCDKTGFCFEVKLKLNTASSWNDAKILQKFKLTKSISENLTVIDYNGKLREYDDARQLIKDFCDFRLGILQKRIDIQISDISEKARWLNVKMNFIQAVLDDNIVFKNKKKAQVVDQMINALIPLCNDDSERLLRINIMSLTDEMVKSLAKEIKEAQAELKFWKTTTPSNQFTTDIDKL